MTPPEIIFVIAIVAVFCTFAAALAWGQHQTAERPPRR
jgi:hypothetical protein